MRRTPSQGVALALAEKTAEAMRIATGQWGSCADVRWSPRQEAALAVTTKAHYVMKVHHVLAGQEETREMPLNPEKEAREVALNPEEETRKVSSLDPEEGTQEAASDTPEETREAPSDCKDEAQGTPSDPEKETREAPSNPEEETLEVPSDSEEEETKDTAGPTELEGTIVPARRKLTISGSLPPNNVKAHVESAGARRRRRSSTARFSAEERGRRRRECVDVRRRGHDKFLEGGGATVADREGHVTGAANC